jgi:hypothetical protein
MIREPVLAALAVLLLSLPAARADQTGDEPGELRAYLSRSLDLQDGQYRAAEADLKGDGGKEVIVYVTHPDYCGSGGCLTLVLERTGDTYRTVMRATTTRPPIRVLTTRHHGWRDLGVRVGGGGITTPYEAAMEFDGHRYPSNPTAPPAHRLDDGEGKVLIGERP